MLLVETLKAVPIPRLHAVYRKAEKLYLVMEFRSGSLLSQNWPSLPEGEKSPIAPNLETRSELSLDEAFLLFPIDFLIRKIN